MKVTQKFARESSKHINSLRVWSVICAEDAIMVRIHKSASQIDHCAHVVLYYSNQTRKSFGWQQDANKELIKLGLCE